MGLSYLIALALTALSARVRVPSFALALRSERVRLTVVALPVAAIAVTFGLEARVLDAAAALQSMPAWQRALPLAILTGNGVDGLRDPAAVGTAIEAFAVIETLLMLALWAALRRAPMTPALVSLVAAGAAALAVEAFAMRLAGPDIYAYVGFGLVADPYHAGALPPGAGHALVAHVWHGALPPSPYGPAWNALCRLLVNAAPGLAAQLTLFRCVGAVALLLLVAALARLQKPVTAALVALDPTLWHVYVTEAHNDIVAVSLLVSALALRRRTIAAVVLVALASAVKLPFLVLGVLVFAARGAEGPRRLPFLAATLLGLAIAWRFGGSGYAWALHRTVEIYPKPLTVFESAAHVALAAVAFGLLALAFVRGRYLWGGAWSPLAFGQFTAWQYLGWGLPYAILDETAGALYLALLPLSAFEVTLVFNGSALYAASRIAIFAGVLAALVISIRRRGRAGRAARALAA